MAAPHSDGELRIEVVDSATGQPIAARMHLRQTQYGRAATRQTKTAGHGRVRRPLLHRRQNSRCRCESGSTLSSSKPGPEYLTQSGQFEIERHADDSKRIEMKRVVDLAKEGWWGGDLDVRRKRRTCRSSCGRGTQDCAAERAATQPRIMSPRLDRRKPPHRAHAVRLGPSRLARQRQARRHRVDQPPFACAAASSTTKTTAARATNRSSRVRAATAAGPKPFTTTCSIAASKFRRSPAAAPAATTTPSARTACTCTAATNSQKKPGGMASKRAACSSPMARCCDRWSKASRPATYFRSARANRST